MEDLDSSEYEKCFLVDRPTQLLSAVKIICENVFSICWKSNPVVLTLAEKTSIRGKRLFRQLENEEETRLLDIISSPNLEPRNLIVWVRCASGNDLMI